MSTGSQPTLFANWAEILRTQNLADDSQIDVVSRWLLITRAAVFVMTFCSAAMGGLLAAASPHTVNWTAFTWATIGLIVAHAANNMINDYFDLDGGVDSEGYARTLYAPHPILSGLISKKGLLTAILVANFIDLGILVYLTSVSGTAAIWFALAGLFISVFYVAPPIKLKHRGLGEPGVALVWGPLMIGGVYYVSTGELSWGAILAGMPYALLVTAVLVGKHVDKHDADKAKGIKTLPVHLGKETSLKLNRWLMIGFYVSVAVLVGLQWLGLWSMLVFLTLPRLLETLDTYREPRPDSPPEGYPIWPLWYVAWAFRLTREAGTVLVIGMTLDVFFPIHW